MFKVINKIESFCVETANIFQNNPSKQLDVISKTCAVAIGVGLVTGITCGAAAALVTGSVAGVFAFVYFTRALPGSGSASGVLPSVVSKTYQKARVSVPAAPGYSPSAQSTSSSYSSYSYPAQTTRVSKKTHARDEDLDTNFISKQTVDSLAKRFSRKFEDFTDRVTHFFDDRPFAGVRRDINEGKKKATRLLEDVNDEFENFFK